MRRIKPAFVMARTRLSDRLLIGCCPFQPAGHWRSNTCVKLELIYILTLRIDGVYDDMAPSALRHNLRGIVAWRERPQSVPNSLSPELRVPRPSHPLSRPPGPIVR